MGNSKERKGDAMSTHCETKFHLLQWADSVHLVDYE